MSRGNGFGPRARGSILAVALVGAGLGLGLSEVRADDQSALSPHGPVASRIANLGGVLFTIAAIVVLLVFALLALGLARRGDTSEQNRRSALLGENTPILVGGILLPAIILIGVFAYTLRDMVALAVPDNPSDVTIEVIGHQWWWEVKYPDAEVATANEIHVPVGKAVMIKLSSADVIHSFWVPNLISKMDLIPGRVNSVWLQADTAGTYRGQCAEFCGMEHAFMAFLVIADPPEQFDAWLAHQAQPAAEPADPLVQEGEQAFLGSACVYCHAVKGGGASGMVGPDLTHLASRKTIAAGNLPNTPGNLAGWIADPQSIKPGNHMPATRMNSADFQALLAYLESLK